MFHRRLFSEFKDTKKKVMQMVLSQWLMLIANILFLLVAAGFIETVVTGEDLTEDSAVLIVTVGLVILIRSLMSLWNTRLSFITSKEVKKKLRTMVYEKLMRMGNQYKKFFQTSEIVQISTEGVEQLEIYFGKYVPQFFYSMLAPITLFVVVGTMSIKVATVLLVCVPLIPLSIIAVQKFAKKMLAKYWGTYTEMGDSFLECLQGLTTLKIYNADERYAKKMDEEAEKFRKVTMRVLIMQLNSISIMDLIAYGGAGAGMILSVLEFRAGNVSLAQCFFMIMVSAEFFLPLRLLGSFFHIAMNGNAAADKIFRLVDLEETENKEQIEDVDGDEICFSGVNFSYDKEKQILFDITLQAEQGLTALVGESGCGKSTITSILMGDNSVDSGNIQVGGIDLQKISPKALRRKVTRIRHDSYLFAGTIRDNLLMGNEAAGEEEMKIALEKVHLLDFVEKSGGLDYILQEKAANLSGGQKQRLALARAILHDSDMYIFDEATSNVDVESENQIMEVVRELAKTKTVLLISHRLANVVSADKIYVLKDGRIVEQGRHEELCKENGYYYKIFSRQKELEKVGKGAVSYE